MGQVVVGTAEGAILIPDPLRCPDHPIWHIAVRWDRRVRADGTWRHKLLTGACPDCGWRPTIPPGLE